MSRPVALVTGGSAGIGLGIARRLLERGCEVVITARGEERLRALAAELDVTGLAADVATEEGRATIVAEVRRLGRLDWLVNPGPVVTTTFPHTELLAHRWKRKLVIDVERCVDDVMRKVDRGGGEVWSHPIFRLPAVLQAVAPCTYDRFFV